MTIRVSASGKARKAIKALLIDLDDTLYRCEQVPTLVRASIQRYMVQNLGFNQQDVPAVTQRLYYQYGTTLAGLVASGHEIDFDDWHKSVHYGLLDYESLLKPDIQLRELLCSIDVPKYILTNADHKHARICLDRLGISDCFKEIFDFEWAMEHGRAKGLLTPEHPVLCKPSHTIYQLALEEMGCEPSEVVFFDDSARNIQAAHELGMKTCVVGQQAPVPGADLALLTMHGLPLAMPELVDQPGLVHEVHASSSSQAEHAQLDEEAVAAPLIAVASGRGSH